MKKATGKAKISGNVLEMVISAAVLGLADAMRQNECTPTRSEVDSLVSRIVSPFGYMVFEVVRVDDGKFFDICVRNINEDKTLKVLASVAG